MTHEGDGRAPVLVVAGPTASGKSALALAVAERFGGVVINADSLQLYRDLRILTARPGPDEMARAPHRLYGVLDAGRACSAGRWRDLAVAEIRAAASARRLPVVVGGTGLYLRALMHGLTAIPAVPREVRARITRWRNVIGPDAFHAELAARDPEGAARLAPEDRQRVTRAMEILEHTGRSQTEWHRRGAGEAPADMAFASLLLEPQRDMLFARCDARFARMVDEGALDEVRTLAARGLAETGAVAKAVGVLPLRRHLAGEITLAEAVRLGQRDTRRYAKRQMTWFRNQMLPDRTLNSQYSESSDEKIFSFISSFLLTAWP